MHEDVWRVARLPVLPGDVPSPPCYAPSYGNGWVPTSRPGTARRRPRIDRMRARVRHVTAEARAYGERGAEPAPMYAGDTGHIYRAVDEALARNDARPGGIFRRECVRPWRHRLACWLRHPDADELGRCCRCGGAR